MAIERRTLLEQLQAQLIDHLDALDGADSPASARDAATLSKELRAITAELESLPSGEVSSVDDLAAKRAARRSAAAG